MVDMPDRIRVAQDADGFWTCREAVSGSQEYVRADLYAALEEQLAEALKALEASASALDEARWGSYVGEYFQNKHDLEGDLDRIAKQASAARRVRDGGRKT